MPLPPEINLSHLKEMSDMLANVIKGMTQLANRIKALEESNVEIHGCLKGSVAAQQGLLQSIKLLQNEIGKLKAAAV